MRRSHVRQLLVSIGLLLVCRPAFAQQSPPAERDATALAKETQNPVSSLISVPLQFNFNNGGDLGDSTLFNLNFQPVIPFKATSDINVIARTIVPINSAPGPDGARFSGIGDIQMQLFLTPSHPGPLILGVGPMFSLPTATATPFQTGTFGAGFCTVIVRNQGPFVLGGLISQVWPAGDSGGEPKTDLFTLQPFINYNFGGGWAAAFAPIITANWDASDGNEWTVPVGLGITRTTVFNGRPMNIGFQYYYNLARPDGSAAQQFRFFLAFLYPEARPRP